MQDACILPKKFAPTSRAGLAIGGVLGINSLRGLFISYHSLEDRLVKNFFNKGKFYGDADKDIYGNVNRPLKQINKKPIIPNDDEIINNNRARSAKLRIAVRI